MENSVFYNEKNTEKTLIESILSNFYILDYGYISNINADKTIDVTHAKLLKTLDGKSLQPTVTKKVEVLTVSGAGFSLNFDYKKGDKVLLLGLKNYVPKTEDVANATEMTSYVHYTRETLKAIPLCVFNSDAEVKIEVEEGALKLSTKSDTTIDAQGKVNVKSADEMVLNGKKIKLSGSGNSSIEINGNTKQFVTWAELNQALTTFVTQLSTALLAATYVNVAGTPTPLAWTGGTPPTSIDISGAKTTTVVTGG